MALTDSQFTSQAGVSLPACRLTVARGCARFAQRVLALWHLTSLDAVSVAVVWSLGFARVDGVRLPAWVLVLLSLVVWTVYVADRLLDAWAGQKKAEFLALRERHRFHWRYRAVMVPMALFAACLAAWLILRFMTAIARERDSMLAAAALAYFARVHRAGDSDPFVSRVFTKELLVGVLFACGCAMPAWVRGPFLPLMGPLIYFAVLAWLNCVAIDRWESVAADRIGLPVAAMAGAIGAAGLLAAACMSEIEPLAATLLAAGAVSAFLLAWLDRERGRLDSVTLRAAADLVLLIPAVLSWVGR